MPTVHPLRGPGTLAPEGTHDVWTGRKSARWVQLTLDTYGRLCWLCGLGGADSADHIIPRSRGGAVYDILNLGPTHKLCNSARGSRPVDVYSQIVDGQAWFTRD